MLAIAYALRKLAEDPRLYSNSALATKLEEHASAVTEWAHSFQAVLASVTLTNDALFNERRLPLRKIAWRRWKHWLRLLLEFILTKLP
jgi:phosphoenolpyruvate-protein kinase (PTS system EI component)